MSKKKSNNNEKSLEKLDAQIAELSKKEKDDKTPVIKKKDLVRQVKAKEIDEEIEKNKKKTSPKIEIDTTSKTKTTKKKKLPENIEIKDEKDLKVKKPTKKKTTTTTKKTATKKKVPENIEIKEIEDNLKVKKATKKKKKNSKTTKQVKKINDNNIIVDEDITTFSEKISSKDIEELENKLREIYDKEVTIKDNQNNDFFVNDFIVSIEEKFNKVTEKVNDKAQDIIDIVTDLSEKPISTKNEKLKNLDVLTVTTWFLSIIFILCIIFFIGFVVWILTY